MAATGKGECPTHERGTDDEVAWVDTEVISELDRPGGASVAFSAKVQLPPTRS